jgi:hypothetical protein
MPGRPPPLAVPAGRLLRTSTHAHSWVSEGVGMRGMCEAHEAWAMYRMPLRSACVCRASAGLHTQPLQWI